MVGIRGKFAMEVIAPIGIEALVVVVAMVRAAGILMFIVLPLTVEEEVVEAEVDNDDDDEGVV